MANKKVLSKETLLRIAEDSGLDNQDSHIEHIHAFLHGLPSIRTTIETLDLTGVEPFMPSLTQKE